MHVENDRNTIYISAVPKSPEQISTQTSKLERFKKTFWKEQGTSLRDLCVFNIEKKAHLVTVLPLRRVCVVSSLLGRLKSETNRDRERERESSDTLYVYVRVFSERRAAMAAESNKWTCSDMLVPGKAQRILHGLQANSVAGPVGVTETILKRAHGSSGRARGRADHDCAQV